MNFTLQDLQQLHPDKKTNDEQYVRDREAYLHGKKGYPTAPPESLPEGTRERYTGCYQMGYNTAEWENAHVN